MPPLAFALQTAMTGTLPRHGSAMIKVKRKRRISLVTKKRRFGAEVFQTPPIRRHKRPPSHAFFLTIRRDHSLI
jgi:hypothetical protein